MFLSILENNSGQDYVRRLAPNETLDIEHHVKKWTEREYDGWVKPTFSRPGSHIGYGCGQFTAEIRRTKQGNGSVWTASDFYLEEA